MSKRDFGIWLFFIVSIIISLFVLLLSDIGSTHSSFVVLPLSFIVCGIIFNSVIFKAKQNIGVLFIVVLFYFRMVVFPVLLVLVERNTSFNNTYNSAIGLQVYEFIFVMLTLYVLIHFKRAKPLLIAENNLVLFEPSTIAQSIIVVLTLFCVIVWFAIPSSRELYSSVFHFSDESFTTVLYSTGSEAVGSLTRAVLTLFKMSFDIVRILFPIYIIVLIRKKYGEAKAGIAISLMFCFFQLLFVPSATARAIISAFLLLYIIISLYPRHKNGLVLFTCLGTVGIVIYYFVVRFNVGSRYGDDALIYTKNIINAYFGGLDNIRYGLNIPTGYEKSTLFGLMYSSIPFNSSLFGLKVENLQLYFNRVNGLYGQIPPMIIEGWYYFGFVFSPLFSISFTIISYIFGEKQSSEVNPWVKVSYLFISIMSAVSIVMYNTQIIAVWFTNWLIPMCFISLLSRKGNNEKNMHYNIT